MSKILGAISRHPLISFLIGNKGNSKTLMLIEPLWGVPYNLIAPFATLYMYAQGITDVQIGLILSAAMFVQVFFSFAGGIITDKLGRKNTLMMGDFFGWSVACVIWALSDNFWFFLAAALLNSFEYINQTAWHCHLVEDTDSKDMLNIYTWVNIAGLVSVFVAPISGLLIGRFTLVPVMRVLYAWFAVNMVIKIIITYRRTKETRQGVIRREETKNIPVRRMVAEYKNLIPQIFKDKATVRMIILSVILFINSLISGSFFGIYVSTRLGVSEETLAVFPILRAAVMLLFMFVIQHHMDRVKSNAPLWIGLGIFALCQLMLIVIPPGGIWFVVLFIFLEAVANAIVYPRKDALLAVSIDPKERARIMALMNSAMIAFSSPFGYFAGVLSSTDRRLPFALSCGLYLAAILITARPKGIMNSTE